MLARVIAAVAAGRSGEVAEGLGIGEAKLTEGAAAHLRILQSRTDYVRRYEELLSKARERSLMSESAVEFEADTTLPI